MPNRTFAPAPAAARRAGAPSTCEAAPLVAEVSGHSLARMTILPAPRGAVQTALMVGSADNAHEREADSVASQVMGTPDSALSSPVAAPSSAPAARQSEEELQAARDPAVSIARQADDEEELQAKRDTSVQRSGEDMAGSFAAGSDVEGGISAKRGGGSALGDGVRSFMEPRFGADFSNVRVHDDAASDSLNRSIGARAFATGSDVFFRQGEYQPNSSSGRQLLAHELTHVVQQGGATASPKREQK